MILKYSYNLQYKKEKNIKTKVLAFGSLILFCLFVWFGYKLEQKRIIKEKCNARQKVLIKVSRSLEAGKKSKNCSDQCLLWFDGLLDY